MGSLVLNEEKTEKAVASDLPEEDGVLASEIIGMTTDGTLVSLISKVCARFGPAGDPESLSWASIVANAPKRLDEEELAYLMNRGPAVVQRVLRYSMILVH